MPFRVIISLEIIKLKDHRKEEAFNRIYLENQTHVKVNLY